ncbi:7320_t:CDS:1, partial [Paraglomus brasilianum]
LPYAPMPSYEERPTWFDNVFGSTMAAFLVHADSPTLVRIELLALTTPALETKGVLEISH